MNRYDRQIRLRGFGADGQQKLADAAVLLVGAGGLGVPAAQYLNAMGVGRLGLVDGDTIEVSNLHRQPAYGPHQVGKGKIRELEAWLRAQNPETRLELHDTFLNPGNALDIMASYDLVIDATDNLPTRYLIDDACLILGIPWVYGALHGFEGQVSVFNFHGGPTYRCLFPSIPSAGEIPDCNALGTLGVLPGIIGNLQALEAVKVICSLEGILTGKLLIYDALGQETRQIKFSRDPQRLSAGLQPAYHLDCVASDDAVDPSEYLRVRKDKVPHLLLDVREGTEFGAGHLPGALNVPLLALEEALPTLDKEGVIYLICETGPRSRQACALLRERLPDRESYWIAGGMQGYKVASQ